MRLYNKGKKVVVVFTDGEDNTSTLTSAAAILGTLPIALGVGAGAELRQPLGLAVVGGLLVSQLLTLYLTPVVYLLLDPLTRGRRNDVAAVAEGA